MHFSGSRQPVHSPLVLNTDGRAGGAAIRYAIRCEQAGLAFVAEAELDPHLPVGDPAILEVAANFLHFKPVKIAQRLAGFGDAVADCRVNAFFGRADDFSNAVRVIGQLRSS